MVIFQLYSKRLDGHLLGPTCDWDEMSIKKYENQFYIPILNFNIKK